MKNTIIKITACLLALITFSSQAASISVLPDLTVVAPGEVVTVSLVADFSGDPTYGGGLDIFFDQTILDFVSFMFAPDLADDPLLRRQPDVLTGELNGIGFGTISSLDGVFVIGELSFVAMSVGASPLTMAVNEGGLGPIPGGPNNPGPFVDLFGAQLPVTMESASVQVVPLPAALWFMLAAVASLGGIARREQRA